MRRLPARLARIAGMALAAAWLGHAFAGEAPLPWHPEAIGEGFDRITELRHVAAAGAQVYVVEQTGRIRVLQPDGDASASFLDLTAQVLSTGFEQGLTGLAFAPGFPVDPRFYVHYIRADGASVVSRFGLLEGDPLQADPASGTVLLELPQPTAIHNCNRLEFGPDGYLYIGCGDGGPGYDPLNDPRDVGNLYGKILRIDVDVSAPATYAIPPDNPHVDVPGARPEIWASGLRNPYRFEFDPDTGDLWLGDVGQDRQEELNHVPRSTPFGVDFGWNRLEGLLCFRPPTACPTNGIWLPRHVYGHTGGRCAIVAGPRLRGVGYGPLRDLVVFGDFCSGEVFVLRERCGSWTNEPLGRMDAPITSFALGPDGDLLLGTYGLGDGRVYRIARAVAGFADGFEDAPGCP